MRGRLVQLLKYFCLLPKLELTKLFVSNLPKYQSIVSQFHSHSPGPVCRVTVMVQVKVVPLTRPLWALCCWAQGSSEPTQGQDVARGVILSMYLSAFFHPAHLSTCLSLTLQSMVSIFLPALTLPGQWLWWPLTLNPFNLTPSLAQAMETA